MTDEQIILLIQAGGIKTDKAINTIYGKAWWKKLKRHIRSKVKNREDAEEIEMDAITAGIFNITEGKFEGRASLNTYFSKIAKYKIWAYWKQRGRNVPLADEEKIAEPGYVPQSDIEVNEIRSVAHKVLDKMGEVCKKVLLLNMNDFSNKEIAKEVGYANAQIAANKKNRCWKKLRNLLDVNNDLRNTLKELVT